MIRFFHLTLISSYLITFSISSFAKIPNLENRDKKQIKEGIAETYIRSMNKWDIPFQDLLENRSGAACIQWHNMTEDFLKSGIFDALGYSQNIPNKKASQIAAVSGCNKMKNYYKLGDSCECEVVITNQINQIVLPIKKFNKNEEFQKAVTLYRAKDYVSSYNKFLKLSEMGEKEAQYNLSVFMLKGKGYTQNYKKAYYWSLSSKLFGEKKSEKIIKKSKKQLSKKEIEEIDEELRSNLEKKSGEGHINAIVPLAKWYITVPKKPDFINSYKWFSVASAFNIENTLRARDRIFKEISKKNLSDIQTEADDIYKEIVRANKEKLKTGE